MDKSSRGWRGKHPEQLLREGVYTEMWSKKAAGERNETISGLHMLKRRVEVEKHLGISTVFSPEVLRGFHRSSQLMSTQEPAGLGENLSSGCKMAPVLN